MRKIEKVHSAMNAPVGGLVTYRAMPSHSLDHLDPFLFLNHHGPQEFPPHNDGLPFGPHPHRGFETLTFVMKGDLVHEDSSGHRSEIGPGGAQWMTAGKGIIHSEVSSDAFREKGGEVELLQLWMNLPARLKMTEPDYRGLEYNDIVHIEEDGGNVKANLISGKWNGHEGPVNSLTGLMMSSIEMKAGGRFSCEVSPGREIFFYAVRGCVEVNGEEVGMHQLAQFDRDGRELSVRAREDSTILFGHGEPTNERIVAGGPFVMNSELEIKQAYEDFQSGKMGGSGNPGN